LSRVAADLRVETAAKMAQPGAQGARIWREPNRSGELRRVLLRLFEPTEFSAREG